MTGKVFNFRFDQTKAAKQGAFEIRQSLVQTQNTTPLIEQALMLCTQSLDNNNAIMENFANHRWVFEAEPRIDSENLLKEIDQTQVAFMKALFDQFTGWSWLLTPLSSAQLTLYLAQWVKLQEPGLTETYCLDTAIGLMEIASLDFSVSYQVPHFTQLAEVIKTQIYAMKLPSFEHLD